MLNLRTFRMMLSYLVCLIMWVAVDVRISFMPRIAVSPTNLDAVLSLHMHMFQFFSPCHSPSSTLPDYSSTCARHTILDWTAKLCLDPRKIWGGGALRQYMGQKTFLNNGCSSCERCGGIHHDTGIPRAAIASSATKASYSLVYLFIQRYIFSYSFILDCLLGTSSLSGSSQN